jgi:hypothetical protein
VHQQLSNEPQAPSAAAVQLVLEDLKTPAP